MTGHKQVEILIDDYPMLVDEGLEDIILNFFHWDIETCNSCIDMHGSVWIEFCDYEDWRVFLQLALRDKITHKDDVDTLWDFLQNKSTVSLVFDEEVIDDPNSRDEVMGTGALIICIGLKFPKTSLEEFKKLFFKVLTPE